jgi:hypothetical protein
MINYILLSFCLFFCFFNFIILINLSSSLLKFYEYYRESQIEKKIKTPKRSENKGLIDLKQVGTYDSRFQIEQK